MASIDRWSAFIGTEQGPAPRRWSGGLTVWRWELTKLAGQWRVRTVTALCLVMPFVIVAGFKVQSATPQDTLFGQWVHTSGFAVPLVILGFCGQWVLPLLTAIVAGDVFSSEDHFGTWKTVLTRSRSRADLFTGKLGAALTYTTGILVLLTLASLLAGVVSGPQPVVGLSGQLVPAGQATGLVMASWATQLPPVLGFCAVAVLLSVLTRSSLAGIGGPLLLSLIMQLASLVNMPVGMRAALLATPLQSWHGLWTSPAFYGPLRQGLVTSTVWFAVATAAAWLIFRRRSIRVAR